MIEIKTLPLGATSESAFVSVVPGFAPAYARVVIGDRPYFLWDVPVTEAELRERLCDADPEVRAQWQGRVMREARYDFGAGSVGEPGVMTAFLAMLDGKGNVLWTSAFDGFGIATHGVSATAAGEIWVTGKLQQKIQVGPVALCPARARKETLFERSDS